ncbi:MAG: sugar ABC transporter ATP-binding protein [Gemmatimonadota bacterium]
MSQTPRLEAVGITKEFSGVVVLKGVSLAVAAGEILGVIGENGAGKSTLVKILAGVYRPSRGSLRIEGRPVEVRDPVAARRLGISMVPQDLNLVDSLTACQNVFLGSELTRGPLLDRPAMRARTAEILGELGTAIDPEARIRDLSVAAQQMVEIAKALVHDAKVLILDEPTTVLSSAEVEVLFRLLRRVRDRGVAVLFISHRLGEVKRLCDRLLVLRDGEAVALAPAGQMSPGDMARSMVGRELSQVFPDKRDTAGDPVLEVVELSLAGVLEGITFQLRAGEILGFAGLVGAGRTELAETLMGLRRKTGGTVRVRGEEADVRHPRQAVDLGLAYLSEDRQGRGVVLDFGIAANVTLASLARYAHWLIDRGRERAAADRYIRRFGVRAASLEGPLRYLSGGNQQKVYLAKWLDTEPAILILDEPTRGIDVSAKVEVYRLIRSLADEGIACLVISSELEELIGLCARVAVMREGRIAAILSGGELTEEEIMYFATGIKEGQPA